MTNFDNDVSLYGTVMMGRLRIVEPGLVSDYVIVYINLPPYLITVLIMSI